MLFPVDSRLLCFVVKPGIQQSLFLSKGDYPPMFFSFIRSMNDALIFI